MTRTKGETAVAFCPPDQLRDILANIRDRYVAVIGLGVFGGGEGAVRFLCQRGARVTVTDLKTAEQLAPAIERLSDLRVRYSLGWHNIRELTKCELIVANQAIPRSAEVLVACAKAGLPMTTPMNTFLALCPAPTLGVTGSVGKSTTTAMLAALMQRGKRPVRLGGNIGISLLPQVDEISADEVVVLELSCFQLEDSAHLRTSPHVAVVTNLTPNHLDRYGTHEAYAKSKRSIVEFQKPCDLAVLNATDPILQQWARWGLKGEVIFFDPEDRPGPLVKGMNVRSGRLIWNCGKSPQVICRRDEMPLLGAHNTANALAASAAALWMGLSPAKVRQALAAFETLEHRLEECGSPGGLRFFNDSDATTPESTMAGVRSFDGPLTLIAGGYNKRLDMRALASEIARRAAVFVTIGASGPALAQLVREAGMHVGRAPVIHEAGSLEDAVHSAARLSVPGSVVLFSPGCASFDMFQNFADRGQQFKELVRGLEERAREARAC